MPYLWMLVGSIFFAGMALLAESLKEQYTFPWITMVRSGVATFLAVLLALAYRKRLVFLRPGTLWLRSISGWLSMICGFYAMTHYDVEIVLALTNMYPLWVAILSWPMLGKLPKPSTWLALLVSTIGMCLLYLSTRGSGGALDSVTYHPKVAIPMAILAGMLSGVALINLHRVRNVDTQAVVAHFSAVSTFLSFLVWMAIPLTPPSQPTDTASTVRILGVGCAATIGQICLTKAFASGHPANVSVVGLSQAVAAAVFKWTLDGRVPTPGTLVGMFLVLIATLWVMLSNLKIQQQKPDLEPR